MTTLSQLIDQYGANAYVFCDAGNGSGFGECGQTTSYDDDAAAAHGEIELAALDAPVKSNDGAECNFASDWIVSGEGDNPYRYRLMF